MQNFLSNVNANNHLSNENSLWCLFQMLQQSLKFDFSMFSKDKNNVLKEKIVVHFPKRTQTMTVRVQKIKSRNNQITQSTLSMKAKIKSKPK